MRTNEEKAALIASALSTPRGRRFLSFGMAHPIRGLASARDLPWEGYPDSPRGTLETWDEEEDDGSVR